MERKTKVLAIGDIHGDTGLVKRLAKKAEREHIDLVILAGDITLGEKSPKNIIGPFIKAKKQVLIIPGNHESVSTIDFLAKTYNIKNLHGSSFIKGDVGFFGAGLASEIGPYEAPESELFRLLENGEKDIQRTEKRVMVTHMHPFGSKAEIFGFKGSKAIRKAIRKFKPDILINAHIHESGGIEEKIGKTQIFNVSKKEKIFEI
ncbi:metallophosphoesterase [Patescibacteria group bacterium]|nr:metallophosphoesterase [Patescibacteria group bacterium]